MAYNPISETWYVDGPADALKAMCRRADVELKLIAWAPSVSDPASILKRTLWLKNTGTKLVRVSGNGRTDFLEPSENLVLDVTPQLNRDVKIPEVVALNNGV